MFIKDKNNNADKQLIPILGNEPEPTKSIVNSIIDISLKTVKSYFPTW